LVKVNSAKIKNGKLDTDLQGGIKEKVDSRCFDFAEDKFRGNDKRRT